MVVRTCFRPVSGRLKAPANPWDLNHTATRVFDVLHEYIDSRDPVSGTVYLVMLVVFALTPLVVAGRAKRA